MDLQCDLTDAAQVIEGKKHLIPGSSGQRFILYETLAATHLQCSLDLKFEGSAPCAAALGWRGLKSMPVNS